MTCRHVAPAANGNVTRRVAVMTIHHQRRRKKRMFDHLTLATTAKLKRPLRVAFNTLGDYMHQETMRVEARDGVYWIDKLWPLSHRGAYVERTFHRYVIRDRPGRGKDDPVLLEVTLQRDRSRRVKKVSRVWTKMKVHRVGDRFDDLAQVVRFLENFIYVPDPQALTVRDADLYVDLPWPMQRVHRSVCLSRVYPFEPFRENPRGSWRYTTFRAGKIRIYDKAQERREKGFYVPKGVNRSRVEVGLQLPRLRRCSRWGSGTRCS